MKIRTTLTLNPKITKKAKTFLKKHDGSLSGLVNYLLSEWVRSQESAEFTEKQLEELAERKIEEMKRRKTKPLSTEENRLLKILLETKEDKNSHQEWMAKNIKEGRHTNPKN